MKKSQEEINQDKGIIKIHHKNLYVAHRSELTNFNAAIMNTVNDKLGIISPIKTFRLLFKDRVIEINCSLQANHNFRFS